VHLTTLGCRLNEAETELWSGQFQAAGWGLCAEPSQADLIIFNTCAVTAEATRKSRQLIGRHKRVNPAAQIVIAGCVVSLPHNPADDDQAQKHTQAALPDVDLIVPNSQKDQLADSV